ncbi:hypothetical protein [Snodgrassella sp. CFCC 13594]|nr:hypothetical protein [Snodgrassella sp. CFCC 13594]
MICRQGIARQVGYVLPDAEVAALQRTAAQLRQVADHVVRETGLLG